MVTFGMLAGSAKDNLRVPKGCKTAYHMICCGTWAGLLVESIYIYMYIQSLVRAMGVHVVSMFSSFEGRVYIRSVQGDCSFA